MEVKQIPTTDFTGEIKIGNSRIPCAVLYPETNPIRVIVQREIVGLLTGTKKGGFERYLKPKNLQKYLPVKFKDKPLSDCVQTFKYKGRLAQAFEGSDLIDICQMYMRARTDKNLLETQIPLAVQSEIIVFAFAKTGIIATIDEVTGFDTVRERLAKNNLLEKYITEEIRKLYRQFPDKFYQLIFKLNGWSYDEKSIKKRPGIVGKWTNEIIYCRFQKGILGKLQEKNPVLNTGHRKYKHYQFLTKEIGIPELQQYISNAIFLMEASSNWRNFWRLLARATGKEYQGDIFEDK